MPGSDARAPSRYSCNGVGARVALLPHGSRSPPSRLSPPSRSSHRSPSVSRGLRLPAIVRRDPARHRRRAAGARLGVDRRARAGACADRARVPAAARRARDRLRPAARPAAAAHAGSATPSRSGSRSCRLRADGRATSCGRRCSWRSSSPRPGSGSSCRSSRTPARPRRRSARSSSRPPRSPRSAPIVLLSLFFSGESRRPRREARAADRASSSSSSRSGSSILGLERSMQVSADAAPAAGHDRRDPRPRRIPAARGLRRARLAVRARGDPRRVPRRRHAEARRPRRGHDPRVLPRRSSRRPASASSCPFFFVSTGIKLDVDEPLPRQRRRSRACRSSSPRCSSCAALPALLYRPLRRARLAARRRRAAAGDVARAFPVVAGQIGVDLGLIRPENYVALVDRRTRLGDRLPARRAHAAARRGSREPCRGGRRMARASIVCARSPSSSALARDARPARCEPRRDSVASAVALRRRPLRRPRLRALRVHERPPGREPLRRRLRRRLAAVLVARAPSAPAGREALARSARPPRRRLACRSPTPVGRSTTTSATASPGRSSARTFPSTAASGSSSARTGCRSGDRARPRRAAAAPFVPMRRVSLRHQRREPTAALSDVQRLRLEARETDRKLTADAFVQGAAFPDLALPDHDGRPRTLSEIAGTTPSRSCSHAAGGAPRNSGSFGCWPTCRASSRLRTPSSWL